VALPHGSMDDGSIMKRSIAGMRVGIAALCVLAAPPGAAEIALRPASVKPLAEVIEEQIREGGVVGAQLLVGTRHDVVLEWSFGYASPDGRRPVESDTRFCIGSCSKPIAAACLMALADAGELDLETPIDKWLPEFGRLRTEERKRVERAPTLRELLSHRGGLFSQREGLTAEQSAMMRDYAGSLGQAAARISGEPLIAEPGEEFAYSGAGYLVAGRVAEVAAGEAFEALLQRTICVPLGMKHTTFFPDSDDLVAVGGARRGRETVDGGAPHVAANPLRLALVSGGLYSNAGDLARFCQMILDRGAVNQRVVLEESTWRRLVSRSFEDQSYGFGWHVRRDAERMTHRLSHTGALSSYRGLMLIDLESAAFVVAVWTLANAGGDGEEAGLSQELKETWLEIMNLPLN